MNDLVSVIITTYKRSNCVENAIKSVLKQTYKNIELIVVDDNANCMEEREKTKKIIQKYPNIILIQNKKNLCGALSRNEGIYRAKGKFIAFLDDDDEYYEEKIEEQYKLYMEHKNEKIGLVACDVENIEFSDDLLFQQMKVCIAPTSYWFIPKKVLEDVGYFEDSICKQDSIVLLKILIAGYKIIKVPKKLVRYNENNANNGIGMSGRKKSNIEGLLNYREWCRKYYNMLKNKKQINDVEFNFSKQLITLYVFNGMKKESIKEFKNMIKLKPFNKSTILAIIKIILPNLYISLVKKKEVK